MAKAASQRCLKSTGIVNSRYQAYIEAHLERTHGYLPFGCSHLGFCHTMGACHCGPLSSSCKGCHIRIFSHLAGIIVATSTCTDNIISARFPMWLTTYEKDHLSKE